MIIVKQKNAGEKGIVYSVCSDLRETGGGEPRVIITLDTLAEAALVVKYLRGDRMRDDDQDKAKALIRKSDEASKEKPFIEE